VRGGGVEDEVGGEGNEKLRWEVRVMRRWKGR
jgi:hypothetical protein